MIKVLIIGILTIGFIQTGKLEFLALIVLVIII